MTCTCTHPASKHDRFGCRLCFCSAQPKAEAPKQAEASLPVQPCGCVPPCEGHHEDES